MTRIVVLHEGKRICTRCFLRVLADGRIDRGCYTAAFLNQYDAVPSYMKCRHGFGAKDPADDGPEVAVIRAVTHRSDWYYRIRLAVPKFVAWCRKVGVL